MRVFLVTVFLGLFQLSIAQTYSVLPSTGLPDLGNSQGTKWGDINNDGLLDLFISGDDGASTLYSGIYLNNGDDTFTDLGANFPQLKGGEIEWLDVNNDGYLDVFFTGIDGGGNVNADVYLNNKNNTFSALNLELPTLNSGGIEVSDFNNDGRIDLFLFGLNNLGNRVSYLYSNIGDNTFQVETTSLPNFSSGDAIASDFNNDGKVDILINGIKNTGEKISQLYLNEGDFTFSQNITPIEKIISGKLASGDFNNDGYEDVVVIGFNSSGSRLSKVYLNNSGLGFTFLSTTLEAISDGSVSVIDVNNDGEADIVMHGIDDVGNYNTHLYSNNGDNTFTEITHTIDGRIYGAIAIGDYDNDGDNDVLATGFSVLGEDTDLLENDALVSNNAPSIPLNLTSESNDSTIQLSWDSSTDAETIADGLYYNLRVGTSSGSNDIYSANTLSTGKNQKVISSNAFHNLSKTIKNLYEGQYYWSVQSVDNSGMASAFSTEENFIICHDFSIGNDTTVCVGAPIPVSAGISGQQVDWYSVNDGLLLSNSNDFEYRPMEADKLVAAWTKPLGCTVYDTMNIEVYALPDFSIGNDNQLCYGTTTQFDAGSSWANVNWYSPGEGEILAGSFTYDHETLKNDTIIALVEDINGCLNYDSVKIEVIALPDIELGANTSICLNETFDFDLGTGWDETNWYSPGQGLVATTTGISYPVIEKDTLIAEVFNTSRCVKIDTIVLDVFDLPTYNLGEDGEVCLNEVKQLNVPEEYFNVNWYSPGEGLLATDQNSYNHLVTKKDTIISEVFNTVGCVKYDSIIIDFITLPDFDLGSNETICFDEIKSFDLGDSWSAVNWYSPGEGLLASSFQLDHRVEKIDTIVAEVFNVSGCVQYDSVIIDVFDLPAASLGVDQSVCLDQVLDLNIGEWSNVNWYSKVDGLLFTGLDFSYQVKSTDDIIAEFTNDNGCTNYDTLQVTKLELPEISIASDTTICFGQSLPLDAGANRNTISWYNAELNLLSTEQLFDYEVTQKDTISVVVTDFNDCANSDSVIVDVFQLPEVNIGQDTTVCFGSEVLLEASGVTTNWYSFEEGLISESTNSLTRNVINPETLIAEVIDANNCVNYDSINVNHFEVPEFTAGEDKALCNNESVTIGGSPTLVSPIDVSYKWLPESGLDDNSIPNPLANPDSSINYILEITTQNNCQFTDSVYVEVDPKSTVNTGGNRVMCFGDSITLGGQPTATGSTLPYEFIWSGDESIDDNNSSNPKVSPSESTIIQLITKTGGCIVDTSYVNVLVNALPTVEVSKDITIGLNETITLFASGGIEYLWSPFEGLTFNDVANPQASPDETTTYTVTVTDDNGCSDQAEVIVRVNSEVFIPNLFTPNGDGNNDEFRVFGTGIQSIILRVFDRYGQEVFMTDDPDKSWDGMIAGKQAASGNYIWTVSGTFYDGRPLTSLIEKTGIIKLAR
ncbi:FG-GAP-like repeat-containing protein [Fulvivirga lutea]|uniref:VCBS repeat-containing protein n=1 Tax=Fulvivirga lutea TaxID=2810512 RepID=A0A974WIV6_9BACT|nr:FG-GAP-like repeat-containing protein [Fulvivirga lutea]QSE98719.1 VCBS repeat-containing protein [Fulvivirga lutea]